MEPIELLFAQTAVEGDPSPLHAFQSRGGVLVGIRVVGVEQ